MIIEKLFLKPGRDRSIRRKHPWIFSGALANHPKRLEPGSLVHVYSADNEPLATGHFASSSIAVKVLEFSVCNIDYNFWQSRIKQALNLRRVLGLFSAEHTNAFRLVHAEGDRMPGLIIDLMGSTAVIQLQSFGMFVARDLIARALREELGTRLESIYMRLENSLKRIEYSGPELLQDQHLFGESSECRILENGYQFNVDVKQGQKTGFFLDQRDNRSLLGSLATNRKLLNAFCYSGAFSVYGLGGGASEVISVDSSKPALELACQNIELNFKSAPHCAVNADCMEYLKNVPQGVDLIVLDPPAFAKRRESLDQGVRAYKRINQLAFESLPKGGLLCTFSCSQLVTKQDFLEIVRSAASQSGKFIRVLAELNQGADHPVSLFHPEGSYLKGLLLSVE